MIKTLVLLSLLFFNASALAWGTDQFHLTSSSTSDSHVRATGQIMSGLRHVLVLIKKENVITGQPVFPIDSSSPTFDMWLQDGPGTYKIEFYACVNGPTLPCDFASGFSMVNFDQKIHDHDQPSAQVQSDRPEIVDLVQSITRGLPNDLAKSSAIHAWITNNIAYDTVSYFTGSYVNNSWDALTTLSGKKAVCQGYAALNAALHRAAGLPTRVILGHATPIYVVDSNPDTVSVDINWHSIQRMASDQEFATATADQMRDSNYCNHSWNEVLLDGVWRAMDTTWDAGYVDTQTQRFTFHPITTYLFPSPRIFNQTHVKCKVLGN